MIFVSLQGKALIEKIWPEVLDYRQLALRGFSENDKQTLSHFLHKMVDNLES